MGEDDGTGAEISTSAMRSQDGSGMLNFRSEMLFGGAGGPVVLHPSPPERQPKPIDIHGLFNALNPIIFE